MSEALIQEFLTHGSTITGRGVWMIWEDYHRDVMDLAIANLRESFQNSSYLH